MMELLWTMVVLAILAGLAAPSVQEMVGRQRLRSATSDIIMSLIMTRSHAGTLGVGVTMQPQGGGSDWSGGWSVLHPDDSLPAIFVRGALKQVTVSGPESVTYLYNGRTLGNDNPKWQISAAGTDQVRCVELELNGPPIQTPAECP